MIVKQRSIEHFSRDGKRGSHLTLVINALKQKLKINEDCKKKSGKTQLEHTKEEKILNEKNN